MGWIGGASVSAICMVAPIIAVVTNFCKKNGTCKLTVVGVGNGKPTRVQLSSCITDAC